MISFAGLQHNTTVTHHDGGLYHNTTYNTTTSVVHANFLGGWPVHLKC